MNTHVAIAANRPDAIAEALEHYLAQEREVCEQINPRTIQLAGSRLFSSNGFPHACLTTRNLGYYLDSQQENRALWYMHAIGNVDPKTAEILQDALGILRDTNADTVGDGGGVSGLVHGLYCALNARKLLPVPTSDRPVYTMEIGPGSGWTTYFLARFGYHTATIDSNPNLIITQRYLMSKLPQDCAGRYQQIPWWDFYSIDYKVPHAFDMVIANHMICEISEWSRLFIAHWAHDHSSDNGLMFFQAWGDESFHSRYETILNFNRHGFELYARNDARFPEISLLRKTLKSNEPLASSFFARVVRKVLRRFPALSKMVYAKLQDVQRFENHQLDSGVSVEKIVRNVGFSEPSFTNPLFQMSKICH